MVGGTPGVGCTVYIHIMFETQTIQEIWCSQIYSWLKKIEQKVHMEN